MMSHEKRRPICPQCGGSRIKNRFVPKERKPKFVDISFNEYAKDLKSKLAEGPFNSSSDIHFPRLEDYSQLVIECEDCGFTDVYHIVAGSA